MLAALGRGVYRRRWLVLALWVVALAVGASLASRLADQLKVGGFDDPDLPSARAAAFIEREVKSTPSSFLLLARLPPRRPRGGEQGQSGRCRRHRAAEPPPQSLDPGQQY